MAYTFENSDDFNFIESTGFLFGDLVIPVDSFPSPTGKVYIWPNELTLQTFIKSLDETRLHVSENGKQQEIVVQKYINNLALPVATSIKKLPTSSSITAAGMVVLPLHGGGRGPIINYGEVISIGLLKSVLANVLSETEMSPTLRARLDEMPFLKRNSKEQSGYAVNGDVITLDHDWTGYPPKIDLSVSHGNMMHVIQTVVGVDPDCITYIEIPPQEILYGHGGIITGNTFTVKAAILEKTNPVTVPINWMPAVITGPPITALTTTSPIFTSSLCMGIRVKGHLSLSNALAYEVAGAMNVQISVDSGPWADIASLYWHYYPGETGTVTSAFDVLLAYDRAVHTYQFRGRLVMDSDDEFNRELTGTVQVDTVVESGSGSVLSNDLQLKWVSKE